MDSGPSTLTMISLMVLSVLLVLMLKLLQRIQISRGRTTLLCSAIIGGPDIYELISTTQSGAIRELAALAATVLRWPDEDTIFDHVMERESQFSTGLVHGIAVPHSRFVGLGRSLVIFARSEEGITWDCIDGKPAHTFFFILTPEEDAKAQLQLLREIGQCADNPDCIAALAMATDCLSVNRAVQEAVRRSKLR